MDGDRPIGDAVRTTLEGAVIVGLLVLIPAGLVPGGTWLWPRGLVFVGVYGAILAAGNIALAIWRPAHFRVRRQGVVAAREKKQPLIDAIGSAVTVTMAAAWLVLVPIDVFRTHLLPAPAAWVSLAGGVVLVIGAALTPVAVWENQFAAPNVQDQTGQGQRIVDTGVYSFVRHPIYLGNLLLFGGAALWLGSTAAFLGVSAFFVATIGRIAVEEKELRARLPEYDDYARRVRGRLIPFLL